MSTEITSAFEGLDQSIIDAISSPAVLERITALVEKSKSPLVEKNKELLGKYSNQNKQIDELGGFESIKTLAQQARDAQSAKDAALAKSGDVDAIRKQAAEALSAKDTELSTLKQSVVAEKVQNALTKAIREAKGDADLLAPHLTSRIQASLENGKVVIKVMDTNGQPMTTSDMKEATVADLVAEYRKSFPRAFDAETKTGSGAKTSGEHSGIANPWLDATRSLTQQNQLARDNPTLAKALALQAGKTLNI
jgi:hypothetical protein